VRLGKGKEVVLPIEAGSGHRGFRSHCVLLWEDHCNGDAFGWRAVYSVRKSRRMFIGEHLSVDEARSSMVAAVGMTEITWAAMKAAAGKMSDIE
jgi:hypothetical protein